MDIADYILIIGFIAAFGELFVLIWFSSQEKEKWHRYSEILAGISTFFLAVALILLLRYFPGRSTYPLYSQAGEAVKQLKFVLPVRLNPKVQAWSS